MLGVSENQESTAHCVSLNNVSMKNNFFQTEDITKDSALFILWKNFD